jgi:hypothetical protein
MDQTLDKAICSFPPRSITDGERQVLLDWIDANAELAAFVSERRSDDPTVYRRIVVLRRSTRQRLYLVHCPEGSNWWMVTAASERENVGFFPTLRAALSFIRPMAQRL